MLEGFARPPKTLIALITLLYFFANFFLVFRFKIIQDTNRADDNITTKAQAPPPDSVTEIMNVYITMVYFAVTTINTVGYGDVIPVNKYEYVVALGFLLSGVFLYGYIMNEIQSLARADLDIIGMRRENIETFGTWLVTLENKKMQVSDSDHNNSQQRGLPLASHVVHQAQKAFNLSLRYDRTSIFQNLFFSQLSFATQKALTGLYFKRFQHEFPGIYSMLSEVLTEHFVMSLQVRV